MKYELWYSVVVRDHHGKVVSRERRRSRSFLKVWNQVVAAQVCQWLSPVAEWAKDIDGANWPLGCGDSGKNFKMNALAGADHYGIVVGTGDTAVAVTDYALETLIVEGLGAGEMNYLITTVNDAVVADPLCSFLIERTVANNSGDTITVKETGIYMYMERNVSPFTDAYGCGVRDVFETPQEVPNGGAITVNYTLRVSE